MRQIKVIHMKLLNKIHIVIFILGVSFSSCSDFLEETSQDLSYINSYQDLDELLLGEAYMPPKKDVGVNILTDTYFSYIHFMADEVEQLTDPSFNNYQTTSSANLYGYYTWQKDVSEGMNGVELYDDARDWTNLYKNIVATNIIIEKIEELGMPIKAEEVIEASRIKGEAFFVRAADYFLLVNLFADAYQPEEAAEKPGVPLKLTNYAESGKFTRASVQKVYEQILSDLLKAEENLRDCPQISMYRINHAGVSLFLSRVYLYMQDYDNAIKWANSALEEAPEIVDLNTFGTSLFNKANKSLIFTMGGNIITENIAEPSYFTSPSMDLNIGQFAVSKDLYNAFDDNDLRKSNFFHVREDVPSVVFYDKQYYNGIAIELDVSDCFSIRTAEAWLNLAEAAACKGNDGTAQNAIDHLLKNRYAAENFQPTNLIGADLVHFIREERRKELCMEGHRWFDLRRYQSNVKYPETKTLYSKAAVIVDYQPVRIDYFKLEPNDPSWTLPIPKDEDQYNGSVGNERSTREPYKTENY